jgi:hypothetical protein
MSGWNRGEGTSRLHGNAILADRIFAMLFCSRAFTLQKFLDFTPPEADAMAVRRRWVFLQVMPPRFWIEDMFEKILRSIRAGDTEVMLDYIRATIEDVQKSRRLVFPNKEFFVVFDEAQDAARCLPESFPSTTEPLKSGSALHELYRFAHSVRIFKGFIISGTRLSMEIVEDAVGTFSAKEMKGRYAPRIFFDVGNFLDKASQEEYVRRHITLSDSPSDRRLLERITHWFVGRCVFCNAVVHVVAKP